MTRHYLLSLLLSVTTVFLTSCGSDSSDGFDFGGAARVSIDASPSSLDTGDRTVIEIGLKNVSNDGLQVKVRFKDALSYVPGSGTLIVDEDETDIIPTSIHAVEDDIYVVFNLPNRAFGENDEGDIVFELQGIETQDEIEVEVDPDPDSTVIFDPALPDFAAEASVTVDVVDS